MSDIRTYRAGSMQEALELVRRELGPDALIVNTRKVPRPRIWPWSPRREFVEVTAGTSGPLRPATSSVPRNTPSANTSASIAAPNSPAAAYAMAGAATSQRRPQSPPPQRQVISAPQPIAARSVPQTPTRESIPPNTRSSFTMPVMSPQPPATNSDTASLMEQLRTLRLMVEQLQQRITPPPASIPAEFQSLHAQLVQADVAPEVVADLLQRLRIQLPELRRRDAAAVQSALLGIIESEFHCGGPIQVAAGRRRVVALVGPTGVGKTTTIAKLAANFRLRAGLRVGLVTVDTYRIAAVEQLRTYAEIIDLPMKVVTNARDMVRALDELAGLDLVLVDTAGRSPLDELQLKELKNLIQESKADEVQLVLSLAASAKTLSSTIDRFGLVQPTSLILTKLDEVSGLGHLLSINRSHSIPISYVTTGQNVPDDIEPANAAQLARKILPTPKASTPLLSQQFVAAAQ